MSSATQTALGRISAGLTDDPAPLDLDWLGTNVAASLKEALAGALVAPLAAARARAIAIVGANLEPIRRFAATLEAAGELTGEALGNAIADAGFVAADGQPATD